MVELCLRKQGTTNLVLFDCLFSSLRQEKRLYFEKRNSQNQGISLLIIQIFMLFLEYTSLYYIFVNYYFDSTNMKF